MFTSKLKMIWKNILKQSKKQNIIFISLKFPLLFLEFIIIFPGVSWYMQYYFKLFFLFCIKSFLIRLYSSFKFAMYCVTILKTANNIIFNVESILSSVSKRNMHYSWKRRAEFQKALNFEIKIHFRSGTEFICYLI